MEEEEMVLVMVVMIILIKNEKIEGIRTRVRRGERKSSSNGSSGDGD